MSGGQAHLQRYGYYVTSPENDKKLMVDNMQIFSDINAVAKDRNSTI